MTSESSRIALNGAPSDVFPVCLSFMMWMIAGILLPPAVTMIEEEAGSSLRVEKLQAVNAQSISTLNSRSTEVLSKMLPHSLHFLIG
ncbi:hypothetical protein D3C75_1233930 [compost metagenome]